MKKKPVRLGRLELEIMQIIWNERKASARDVFRVINKKKELAYTTITTTLKNLEKKGYVNHHVEERTFIYKPIIEKKAIQSSILKDIVDSVFQGSGMQLMNTLVDNNKISEKEIEELLHYIHSVSKDKKSKK